MNENMNYNEVEVMEDIEMFDVEDDHDMNPVLAGLIGAGITGAAFGIVKLAKKGIAKIKEKREVANERHETVPADEAKPAKKA